MRVNSKNQLVRSDQPCPTNWKDYRKNYDRIFKAVPQERPAPKPAKLSKHDFKGGASKR